VSAPPRRLLFVCTGNICRSPMADVIASSLSKDMDLVVASAGTASWHVGEPMDRRAADVLAAHGYDPNAHRAQHATKELLAEVGLVLGMDRKHLQILRRQIDPSSTTLALLRTFDPGSRGATDIEDPYYGTDQDFVECFAIIDASVRGLLAELDSAGR
jgi:protein-tyrosine phosphatase